MTSRVTNIAVLGSTGSIGRSALEVIAASEGRLRVVALSAHSSLERLCEQANAFRPQYAIATDLAAAEAFDFSGFPSETTVLIGSEKIHDVVTSDEVDTVLAAIVGSAGLHGTWSALEAGKTVAVANKEPLVMAGALVMELAQRTGAKILPVDSEHSAIFQAMQSGSREELKRVVLTASGGPFRQYTKAQMDEVTVDEALSHPTWEMGPKITVDSATMMNKALEIIEARWLFDLKPEEIDVVIHPQSIVHSLVEFVDGSVLAQMSPPDMKLPIQYALTWPDRVSGVAERLDLTGSFALNFEAADFERFPALELGMEAARVGGTTGAVLGAANEAAVARFLDGNLPFSKITSACRAVLNNHNFDPQPTLDDLLKLDRWAREEVTRWVHK